MADSKLVWAPRPDSDEEAFFRAPLGTPLPTDAVDILDPAFEGHGNLGEDGVGNNISRDTTKHRNFGGRVVKTTQDAYEETITVTFQEQNPIVLETVFGTDNVTVDTSEGHRKMRVNHDDAPLPRQSFVFRAVDGAKTTMHVIPEGQVTEVDEIQLVHSGLWEYTVTIDCYKPGDNDGVNTAGVNVYFDEPDVPAGS